jgi:hypothetical protein
MKQELPNNYTKTIGATSTVVSEQCFQQRTAIIITNTSAAGQTITISIGQEAAAGQGIQLSVGGVYSDTRDTGYFPSNDQINAISSAVGGTVAVHERILMNTYK